MKLGGWKSERMVMRYAHVNVAELPHTINNSLGEISGTTRREDDGAMILH